MSYKDSQEEGRGRICPHLPSPHYRQSRPCPRPSSLRWRNCKNPFPPVTTPWPHQPLKAFKAAHLHRWKCLVVTEGNLIQTRHPLLQTCPPQAASQPRGAGRLAYSLISTNNGAGCAHAPSTDFKTPLLPFQP